MEKEEEDEEAWDGGQPSLLTLKNGRPGAFNNPCASNPEEGGNDTSYQSPEPASSNIILTSFSYFLCLVT